MQCLNSHKFCFVVESFADKVIVVDKIIIVQMRDFLEINSIPLPVEVQMSSVKFFLDSQVFELHSEIPIVVICHIKDTPETRIIEQHHFMVGWSVYRLLFTTMSHNTIVIMHFFIDILPFCQYLAHRTSAKGNHQLFNV